MIEALNYIDAASPDSVGVLNPCFALGVASDLFRILLNTMHTGARVSTRICSDTNSVFLC